MPGGKWKKKNNPTEAGPLISAFQLILLFVVARDLRIPVWVLSVPANIAVDKFKHQSNH
ncbi:MAG: hypothetical protein ABSE76_02575 [Minisyncoccia bacterium]|jgi:hypothetical protein